MVRPVKLTNRMGVSVLDGPDRDEIGRARVTLTASTAETNLIAAVGGQYADIFSLRFTNTSASAAVITLRDGGTVVEVFAVPAGQTVGFHGPASGALKQAAANTNWTVQSSASLSSIECVAQYVKRAY